MLGLGAGLGALAVVLGAFGAHSLKDTLTASGKLDVYQTAVTYHFYHVFALIATGVLMEIMPIRKFRFAAWFFLIGILLFSGSLYLICLTNISKLGIITPIGGVFFIAGWVTLVLGIARK
jgi:uncharacterized membrane protein YgdD (TMEM256/DUF423 family)